MCVLSMEQLRGYFCFPAHCALQHQFRDRLPNRLLEEWELVERMGLIRSHLTSFNTVLQTCVKSGGQFHLTMYTLYACGLRVGVRRAEPQSVSGSVETGLTGAVAIALESEIQAGC